MQLIFVLADDVVTE